MKNTKQTNIAVSAPKMNASSRNAALASFTAEYQIAVCGDTPVQPEFEAMLTNLLSLPAEKRGTITLMVRQSHRQVLNTVPFRGMIENMQKSIRILGPEEEGLISETILDAVLNDNVFFHHAGAKKIALVCSKFTDILPAIIHCRSYGLPVYAFGIDANGLPFSHEENAAVHRHINTMIDYVRYNPMLSFLHEADTASLEEGGQTSPLASDAGIAAAEEANRPDYLQKFLDGVNCCSATLTDWCLARWGRLVLTAPHFSQMQKILQKTHCIQDTLLAYPLLHELYCITTGEEQARAKQLKNLVMSGCAQ